MGREVLPKKVLTKDFLSQCKSEDDVSRFLKDLHSQVLEQLLQDELDSHLGYEKHSVAGIIVAIRAMGAFPKRSKRSMAKVQFKFPETVMANLSLSLFPNMKVELSIERLVI